MAEDQEKRNDGDEAVPGQRVIQEALERAARRMGETPEDVTRIGGGTGNFGRGDRSMFDPAAEEDPEDSGELDGSLPP
jgi:hypothetical protein